MEDGGEGGWSDRVVNTGGKNSRGENKQEGEREADHRGGADVSGSSRSGGGARSGSVSDGLGRGEPAPTAPRRSEPMIHSPAGRSGNSGGVSGRAGGGRQV